MADGFFQAGSIGLLVVGVLLILIVLVGRFVPIVRRRAARICPKCGYDMRHTPGMRCSECGYEARSEGMLHRRRMRWRLVLGGVLLLFLSYGAFATPRVRARGWVGAVPTTMLIAGMPILRPNMDVFARAPFSGTAVTSAAVACWRDDLFKDLVEWRVKRKELWGWQVSLAHFMCRWQAGPEIDPRDQWETLGDHILGSTRYADGRRVSWSSYAQSATVTISGRRTWPHGFTIYQKPEITAEAFEVKVRAEPVNPDVGLPWCKTEMTVGFCATGLPPPPWRDGLLPIGRAISGIESIDFNCAAYGLEFGESVWCQRWRALRAERISVPYTTTESIESIALPVENDDLKVSLSGSLEAVLAQRTLDEVPDSAWSVALFTTATDERDYSESWDYYRVCDFVNDHPGVTFAFRIEVRAEDEVVASGEAWYRGVERGRFEPWGTAIVLDVHDEKAITNAKGGAFTLRLIGDANVALRDEKCTKYWQGTVEVPLKVIRPAPPPPA
jgi:hypothetical protein